jgi:hypothetical protein
MIPFNTTTGSNLIHVFDRSLSDMIGGFGLQIKIPRIHTSSQNGVIQYADNLVWKNDIGHALIESIHIINGDEELFRFTGDYLNVIYKLDTHSSKLQGVNEMISHYNSKFSLRNNARTLYVDVPFLKIGDEYQYFPLINTTQNSFKMVVKFKKVRELICTKNDIYEEHVHIRFQVTNDVITCCMSTTDPCTQSIPEQQIYVNIMYDSINLTHEERNLFMTNQTNILYQTIQYRQLDIIETNREANNTYKIQLDFAHNILELIVVLHDTSNENSFMFVPIEDIIVHLHGIDIKNKITSNRYDNKHMCIPNYHIYVIPFCLSATTNQPTGTFSFDANNILTRKFHPQDHQRLLFEQPINNITDTFKQNKFKQNTLKKNELKIVLGKEIIFTNNHVVKVFARSFNVLRIQDKHISLQYL